MIISIEICNNNNNNTETVNTMHDTIKDYLKLNYK
jgi:hypothetical protein